MVKQVHLANLLGKGNLLLVSLTAESAIQAQIFIGLPEPFPNRKRCLRSSSQGMQTNYCTLQLLKSFHVIHCLLCGSALLI
jgi:hypothetical protein